MADNKKGGKKGNKNLKDHLQNLLGGLGLGGEFSFLIDRAVRGQMTPTDFLVRLVHTNTFRRQYPGLMNKGELAPFLSDNPSAFSVENLGSAIAKYNSLTNAYELALRGYDIKLTPQLIGELIRGQKSPDEFATDINIVNTVNHNPGLKDIWNQELVAAGKEPMDEFGLFKALKGVAPKDFYDIYEAASLRNAGLNLTSEQALQTAQGIGAPGQPADLSQLVSDVYRFKNDIQPELDRQGIGDADLALLASGQDARNLTPVLQGLIANKRARGTPVYGYQGRRGSGGGVATAPEEDVTSF